MALSSLLSASAAMAGGPVILIGHDPDDHGFQTVYAGLLSTLRSHVTNGGNGILAIGANPGSDAGNWINSVASQMTPPQTVTFVNGSAITNQSFAGFAILYVPSTDRDVNGGIGTSGSPSEQTRLVNRAVDVASFITNGGGLFGLTQDSVSNPYQYLGPFAQVTSIGIDASGDCDAGGGSALYDNVTSTPLGQTLGITDTNIDGCCWHNAFSSHSDFLKVLAIANEPLCTVPAPINALPAAIGCLVCGIPGQLGLAPSQAFNHPGTVHALTATLVEAVAPNNPISGVNVTFSITSGPNAGQSGVDATDVNGEATFSYTGGGGTGVDHIRATSPNPGDSGTLNSNEALKFWDLDCNANSVPDTCDTSCAGFGGECILFPGCGASADADLNGVPDECQDCVGTGACDDDNPCTQNDTCTASLCAGTPINCSSLDTVCAVGACNVLTGACEPQPTNQGGACDDGLFCNGSDTCNAATCSAHSGNPCAGGADCADTCNEATDTCFDASGTICTDDGNVCTNDQCNGSGTCVHPNNTASCDDGLFCNGADTCSGGACASHAGNPCPGPDGDGNCSESCNESSDDCTAADPNGSACTDGLFCTGTDTCSAGACSTHSGDPCPGADGDGNCSESCNETADNCTAADPNGSACTDSLFCTGTDTCSGGSCSAHAGNPCAGGSDCADSCNESVDDCFDPSGSACTDDGNACTNDTCNGSGTCAHPNNTASCNDGLFCNGADTCSGGSCASHAGNPCTGGSVCADACNESADNCFDLSGSACTSDGNVCTDDQCDGSGTCAHTNNTASCNDGLFCNGTDTCSGGSCSHTGDPCPGADGDSDCSESCNESGNNCNAADPNGSTCSDGLFCTGVDTCSSGNCSVHAGNPCPGPDGDGNCSESCDETADNCAAADPNGSACTDGLFCTGTDTCSAGACSMHSGNPCPGADGDSNCSESCNEAADNCAAADPNGSACTDDGNVCTNDQCNGTGTCAHPNNTSSCDDGDACTVSDTCAAGSCHALPACGNGTVEAGCGEECDPPNGSTCNASCLYIHTCGNGILEPLETCDDGNTLGGDCCDATCQLNPGPCDDGNSCTVNDLCVPSGCAGTPLDCSFLDSDCTDGQCDSANGECKSVPVNEGGPCDDGNTCGTSDVCQSGICSSCGNGSVDTSCGETCDPPASGTCDPTCLAIVCGNSVIQAGEECDDGNAISGDGCSNECKFEDKVCVPGTQPSVSGNVIRVVFASTHDYVGTNPDRNQEIFLFQRKLFDKALKTLVKQQHLDLVTAKDSLLATRAKEFVVQLTKTEAPVVNEYPTLNGGGRVAAFVSTGDLVPGAPGNPDGNREIYRMDIKLWQMGDPTALVQVTDSPSGIDNKNPNLRALRANLLAFDSNGNLAATQCVGGDSDRADCATNADCDGGACGNPEGNREVFVYFNKAAVLGLQPLRQVTASASGDSTVGQSQNFNSHATPFSSTSNLQGQNPEYNSEIFRVERTAETVAAITTTASGNQTEPAQAIRTKIAFTSNGDLAAQNADGNREIFFYHENEVPAYTQLGTSLGCFNAGPSIDARGRYVAFHSTCNRIPSLGNPDQSIFIWDDRKLRLLPLVVRGERSAASAHPQATKRVSILTYESNIESLTDPSVCFLNVGDLLRTLEAQQ